MKSSKRATEKAKKQEVKKQHGKPGAGKSKFALKQKIDNRPGSPFRTVVTTRDLIIESGNL